MEITQLSEEEQIAITAPEPTNGPSKDDLVRQIEADYLAAQRDGDTDAMSVLDERHALVLRCQTDSAANTAYSEHCAQIREEPVEAVSVVSEGE